MEGHVEGWGRVDPDALARDDADADPLGGRVERTGIALVRRGETVTAEGDGAAVVRPGQGAAPPGVVLEIPVTVEIGPSVEEITEAAAELALRRLREALAARALG
ncbi:MULTISPECIES: hypothetical protein [Protofrankia]|uniref:Uncharacterized protein n=1 Tax=Protofrankia coriariae TaxID=1562887 RepID=A0ABR5EYW4_9ACTN|nr:MULTISPECIES: hypothetical protein [Protofrankia]KLL09605.1 hypothetical protein FrCorBMG51_23700 [Protofrankia coriariae]ONH34492.1 hypothetical protein BL254_15680 [Protofrankia sp. BMG5.30]